MSSPTRRTVVMGLSALPLAIALPAFASAEGRFVEDVVIGDADAPVTVYEYVSYTCGYCGRFHQSVWPQIKQAYVDTGKAKFVIRGFYRNTVDLDIDLLARCGGEQAFYPMADSYLNSQSIWSRADDINAAITTIAKRNGMPQASIDECLADFEFKKELVERFRANAATHEVESTPTFVINDTAHRGLISFEDLSELIEGALA